jgi:hypothetical protein
MQPTVDEEKNRAAGAGKIPFTRARRVRQPVTSVSHSTHPFNSQPEGKMTLAAHLAELSEKHRILELRIQEELARPGSDDLHISKLKKEKLRIRDEMAKLQSSERH